MLLKTRDAARILQVAERTVLSWINRQGLPATRIGSDYQVSRMDLLQWATENGIPLPPDLFTEEEPRRAAMPSFTAAFSSGGIRRDVAGSDRNGVLMSVVELLDLPPDVDRSFLHQTLLAREALGTTAVGDGIAVPHVRNPILVSIDAPSVTLCFMRQPVDFQALDGKPVDTLFTILSPTVPVHLHLLSLLAYLLRHDIFRALVKDRADDHTLFRAAADIEGTISHRSSHG